MGRLPIELRGDAGGDPIARHVREFLIHELGGIGAAFADEAGVEPLLGDALELAEEMELGFLAGIAPFSVEQSLGEVEHQRGGAHVAQVLQIHVHAFTDDAGVSGYGRADQIGSEFKNGIVVELAVRRSSGSSTR